MSRELKIGLGALLLAGTLIYVSSLLGNYPGAREAPSNAEATIARHLRSWSMPRDASSRKNPFTNSPELLQKSARHFADHCASCHGKDGKGKGPAAASLKTPPPDLTTLAQRNDGKFPKERVVETISGEAAMSAHGSREMPVWGPFFLALSGMKEKAAKARVEDLANYIETIQSK